MTDSIKIEIKDQAVAAAFRRLHALAGDLTPAMQAIAGILHDRTVQNFEDETGPTGKWAPLKNPPRNKSRSSPKLLRDSGRLAASITAAAGADFAQVGASAIYAAIHQLGGTIQRAPFSSLKTRHTTGAFAIPIPARPFLPFLGNHLQEGVEDEILAVLQRAIQNAVQG